MMIPSEKYIKEICELYGDIYDDRIEDSRPQGGDWQPGVTADHKSLAALKKELSEMGIELSTSKIKKILISGGCWTTARSREIADLYERFVRTMKPEDAIKKIADRLEVSIPTVCMNLPYGRVVYGLEDKTSNAKRCDKWRRSLKDQETGSSKVSDNTKFSDREGG